MQRNAISLQSIKYPVTFTSVPDLEQRYPNADGTDAMARWIDSMDRL